MQNSAKLRLDYGHESRCRGDKIAPKTGLYLSYMLTAFA